MSNLIVPFCRRVCRWRGFGARPHSSPDSFAAQQSPIEHAPDVAVLHSRRFTTNKQREAGHRTIYVNDHARNRPFVYADNRIRTSKYTILTFIPVNLFEQFQRVANFYFLFFVILVLIPFFSPIMPVIFIFPLVFVLTVTAVKDAFDDVQRHRNDGMVNNRISYVCRQGLLVQRRWKDVQVGDIVRLESDHFVAADVLLLSSSEPNGLCYIETCELDGETNLKVRQCLTDTSEMGERVGRMGSSSLRAKIVCEAPNEVLNRFRGTIELDGSINGLEIEGMQQPSTRKFALSSEQMLLRGCIMRNTQWCYGVVIYCGCDTKLMQNSGKDKHKSTSLDDMLNKIILGIILFLILLCIWCASGYSIFEYSYGQYFRAFMPWPGGVTATQQQHATTSGGDSHTNSVRSGGSETRDIATLSVLMFFSYSILLNGIVPVSLYVSVEFLRLAHSYFISNDACMVDPNGVKARARSTTLNEELGQIEYIFSDKTGTLTENVMTFRYCSIFGRCFGLIEDGDDTLREPDPTVDARVDFGMLNPLHHDASFVFFDQRLASEVRAGNAEVDVFFRLLALCHTVMSEERAADDEVGRGRTVSLPRIVYQAQSPDEGALVNAARNFGFMFVGRTPTTITIRVFSGNDAASGTQHTYDMLAIFDFNNVRKRMSVLVREQATREITLFMKGADNVVLERLAAGTTPVQVREATEMHLDRFAVDGLRTLVLAYRHVEQTEFDAWWRDYEQAQCDIDDRDERLDAVYEKLERNMTLVGCTAIEDKLQEGVPATIAQLLDAGMRIWVITGDKMETAINIGYSCKLLHDALDRVFVVDGQTEEMVDRQLREARTFIDQSSAGMQQAMLADHAADAMPVTRAAMLNNDSSDYNRTPGMPPAVPLLPNVVAMPPSAVEMHAPSVTFSRPVGGIAEYNVQSSVIMTAANNNMNKPSIAALTLPRTFALVMLGSSFAFMLNASAHHRHQHNEPHHPLEDLLLRVSSACSTVICCRATPLQKALIVRMVRKRRRAVTLAIGDGANDVSMIKEAHVGVGISGQEGMQAVLASDYSIGQFQFLARLLLVHGRWSYFRMSKFFTYFFYKNFAFSMSHFFFAMVSGYTAASVFDPWMVSFYNLFYTSLPVMAMGFFDQDVTDRISLQQPALYLITLRGKLFNTHTFVTAAAGGVATALVIVFGNVLLWRHDDDLSGVQAFSDAAQTQLVLAVTLQICWMTDYWTKWNVATLVASLVAFFGIGVIQYCNVLPTSSVFASFAAYRGVHVAVYTRCDYWLATVLILTVLMAPVVAYKWACDNMWPSLKERIKQNPHAPWSMASAYSVASSSLARRMPATGSATTATTTTSSVQHAPTAVQQQQVATSGMLLATAAAAGAAARQRSVVAFRMSRDGPTRVSTISSQGLGVGTASSTRQFQPNTVRSSYAFSQESGWARILQQGLNMRAPAADGLKRLFSSATPSRIVERIQENLRPLSALLALPSSTAATAKAQQQPQQQQHATTIAKMDVVEQSSTTPSGTASSNMVVTQEQQQYYLPAPVTTVSRITEETSSHESLTNNSGNNNDNKSHDADSENAASNIMASAEQVPVLPN